MRKLLFVLMTAFASLDAGAQTFFTQGNLLFTVNEENPTTVSVKKAFSDIGGEIVIPSTVVNEDVTYTVTLITGNAFYNTAITSVTIPASVDSIGSRAFESCASLTNIRIDDSDKELKLVSGFYGILYGANADKSVYVGRNLILSENSAPFPNATSVEFGDKVTAIYPSLFYNVDKLSSITIGNGVTEIGDHAFYDAGDAEDAGEMTVTLGENVRTIGGSAFEGCDKLKSIALPSTLKVIEGYAFNGTDLTALTIPASVDSIGERVFANNANLAGINIEDADKELKLYNGWYGAFYSSDADKSIYIGRNLWRPENTTVFGGNVTSVAFGDNVTTINPNLFYDANKLSSVTIGSGVTEIGDHAFYSAGDAEDVGEMTVTLGENIRNIRGSAFEGCSKLKSLTLPEKLDTIFGYAFQSSGLTAIAIPASVDSIGDRAFAYCASLASIRIQDSTAPLILRNGYYGTFAGSDAEKAVYIGRDVQRQENSTLVGGATSVEIGDQMTTINPYLFNGANKMRSLIIGNGVKTIGAYAFKNAGSDTETVGELSITMGGSVTSIGEEAFNGCTTMKSVKLPSTLKTIDQYAFSSSGLTAVIIPASVDSLGVGVFGNNANQASITFEDGDQPLKMHNGFYGTFRNPTVDYTLYLGRNLVYEDMSGSPFPNVTSATIGSQVTNLPQRLFYDRDKLTTVTGGEGVETMGAGVYYECNNLESISPLGKNLKVLPESTFELCEKLDGIVLPDGLEEIQQWAFHRCRALTALTIPASVKVMGTRPDGENGYRVFYENAAMKTLVFEDSDTPLRFIEGSYGGFCRGMTQLETLYMGRDITTEGYNDKPFTAARDIILGPKVTSIGSHFAEVTASSVKAPWQTPIAIDETAFNKSTYENATLWLPGGTREAYEAADGWKNFLMRDFASFIVTIESSKGGSLTVGDATATGGHTAVILMERETDAVITAVPAEGYALTALTVNGEAVTAVDGVFTITKLLADQTVVATFSPVTYTIAYDLDGGTGENPTEYTIESDNITLASPTKEHYTFAGWTGTGLDKPTANVVITKGSVGNREYKANWTPVEYTITYDLDGGMAEGSNPTTYTIESDNITLVNPTKEFHQFVGWTGTGLDAPAMEVVIPTGSYGNREYKANWERNAFTVTITGNGVTADNYAPKYGDTVTLTIVDDPDATLTSLTVNGVDVTAQVVNNQYVIERVEENITVEAVFRSLYEYVRMTDRMATFSCPQDLNFTGSDVKAYIAAGYNKQDSEVLLVRVYDVPAGTGLVLKGEAGATYKVPYSESQSYYVNLLKAQLTAGTVAPTEGESSNFLLRAEADDEFRFGIVEGETRLAGQQAYLQVPTSFVAPGTAYVKIIFADEDPSAVERFTITDEQSRDAIYNLGGIKMTKEHLRGGVYIVNGKKVKVK